MSFKIAAEGFEMTAVVVREYDEERDREAVLDLERRCEVGPQGKFALFTDLLGDPICRVRLFPCHVMLVAEYGDGEEIVGVIRACIKTVTCGKRSSVGSDVPNYEKLAYILGLRVSPTHRRLGIGTKLVQHLETWCVKNGAKYAYMATDCSNKPSINLFTKKQNYQKFRTPTMLVQPVHAHHKSLGLGISIVQVPSQLAESIYRRVFKNSEFFPKDIDQILRNKFNIGTFMAVPKKFVHQWNPESGILPPCFAILSVWNTKDMFKLQVKGVSNITYAYCKASRAIDTIMPWLKIPSIPNVFSQFGVYLMYGLHMEGSGASRLLRSLCNFAHNLARDDEGCGALVAEVGRWDPVRENIPHWERLSLDEDLWCMKKLARAEQDDCGPSDLIKAPSSTPVIFVDPRDF